MTQRLLLLAAFSLGCGDKEDTDTGDTEADADADTDTDTDTDADADINGTGELVYEGEATADASSYSGTETATFTDDSGDGEVLCKLEYSITSTTVRDDCDICDWAFDVQVSGVKVLVDNGCDQVGMDGYEGQARSYGYTPEFHGHAQLLMVDEGAGWQPGDYASQEGKAFDYYWIYGLVDY